MKFVYIEVDGYIKVYVYIMVSVYIEVCVNVYFNLLCYEISSKFVYIIVFDYILYFIVFILLKKI